MIRVVNCRSSGINALLRVLVLLLFVSGIGRAQTPEEVEARLKSAFLLNFARYVEWPPSAFAGSNNVVVIGIVGQDPLKQHLDDTVQGKTVERRPVEVKRSKNISELLGCHVLFVPASERERLRMILTRLQDRPVLTVSDMDGFKDAGGMIQLKKKSGMMRFDINRSAAEKAHLKISSKLLKLADNPQ
jgi:hypothetical protein